MYVDEIRQLDAKVVACYFVDLDTAFLYVVRAQTNENGVSPFLTPEASHK